MGKITEHLINIIAKQVKDKGVVVWYDPDKTYSGIVKELTIPDTVVLHFKDSFFRLKRKIDPYLEYLNAEDKPRENCSVPPKVLVYVPLERRRIDYALIEIETAGTVLEPGASSPQRNTRLRVLAETVFGKIAPDQVQKIGKQVEEGLLSIAELDKIADEIESVGSSVIKLIFDTTAVEEVVLRFVSTKEYDEAIISKKAVSELTSLFLKVFGVEFTSDDDPEVLRKTLAGALLTTEFLNAFPAGTRPEALSFLTISDLPAHAKLAESVCSNWRNRADFCEAYLKAARTIEKEKKLDGIDFLSESTAEALMQTETFPSLERKYIEFCEAKLLSGRSDEVLKTTNQRMHSFWSIQEPVFQLRWSILRYAALVLRLGDKVRREYKNIGKDPVEIMDRYTDSENPLCLLDTYYRHMEHRYALFDLEPSGEHENLEKLIALVRKKYTETLESGIEKFTNVLAAADFQIEGRTTQDEIFSRYVAPNIKAKRKTAYILVDALRYEMGREIADELAKEFEAKVEPATALLPSITSVGMAALMPKADNGMELVKTGGGKLAVAVGSTILKNRSDRLKFLQENTDAVVATCKLNGLIKPSKKLRDKITTADLVVVTSQELDKWGEAGDADDEIRLFMEEVLDRLGKGIRRLAALGADTIIVTADHGHLFGETIEGGMRMDSPGGDTVELHGRVWIGKGGAAGEGYLRVHAGQLGLGGNFELAFPRSLACFKTKGGTRAYCHGGISLQEMVLPVIRLQKMKTDKPFTAPAVYLEMSVPKVTNRFFSVLATYKEKGLFATTEIRAKLVVNSDRKEVGTAAMAAYGFETGTKEIILKKDEPNPITIMLTQVEGVQTISIHVLDAVSQVEIGRLKNIPVDILI